MLPRKLEWQRDIPFVCDSIVNLATLLRGASHFFKPGLLVVSSSDPYASPSPFLGLLVSPLCRMFLPRATDKARWLISFGRKGLQAAI